MQSKSYDFTELPKIFDARVNGRRVWDGRLKRQHILLQILSEAFAAQGDMYRNAFAFDPGVMYFATPLTTDPAYTQTMKPTWYDMKGDTCLNCKYKKRSHLHN